MEVEGRTRPNPKPWYGPTVRHETTLYSYPPNENVFCIIQNGIYLLICPLCYEDGVDQCSTISTCTHLRQPTLSNWPLWINPTLKMTLFFESISTVSSPPSDPRPLARASSCTTPGDRNAYYYRPIYSVTY